jgi:hypothetical protein
MILNVIPWLLQLAISFHPFFISMTDINYNSKSRSVEISVRIFTDDFEKTLRKNCNCKIDLLKPVDPQAAMKLANSYILNRLKIKINGQPVELQSAGYEREAESIWNYFEVKNVKQLQKMEVINSLLHDYREEQINMIHVKANGKEETDKLDFPKTAYSISF